MKNNLKLSLFNTKIKKCFCRTEKANVSLEKTKQKNKFPSRLNIYRSLMARTLSVCSSFLHRNCAYAKKLCEQFLLRLYTFYIELLVYAQRKAIK